ncbi:unnamed protein product [Cuscuta campestris]|uniref:WDR11 second beta-propeller domain-containing protein n=1 Tax=Cuscuta campestris TaxID=132261 RepID=A0A484NHX1_9ASTE|nr:unnamed protein product [Cuscuta campestris]
MAKTLVMLRSIALPFTVVEWSFQTVPRPSSKDRTTASVETSSPKASPLDSKSGTDGPQNEFSECFSFALANGALGVFEVQGKKDPRLQVFIFSDIFDYTNIQQVGEMKVMNLIKIIHRNNITT